MKRKIFILTIIVLITMFMLGIGGQVKATESSFKASLSASSTELKPGQEVTITMAVSDINMGDNGINTVEGIINYDKTIFEELTTSSVQSLNNWTTTLNTENSQMNGKFLAANLSNGVKENMQIFSVKFKVKADATSSTETTITYKDITSNDGTNLVSAGTKSVNIKINAGTSTQNSTSGTSTTTQAQASSNLQSSSATSTNIVASKDKTGAKSILPRTGKSAIGVSIIGIVIAVSVLLWVKNRSMKDIK